MGDWGEAMRLLKRYLRPLVKDMAIGLGMKALAALMVLLLPYLLAYVIDTIVPMKDMRLILAFGIGMIVISVIGWIFDIRANRIASRVARDAIVRIRHDLFDKTIRLSCRRADEFTIPSLESRLTSDTYHVHRMIGMIQRMGVRAPILLLGGIGVTLLMEPVLALVMIATLPLITVLVVVKATRGIPMFTRVQKAQDRMISVVRENAQGVRVIKALSKADHEKRRYEKVNTELVEEELRANSRMAAINPLMNLLMNLGLVGVILVGAWRVSGGLSETGKIIAFTNYFTIITNAMMSISRIFVMLSKGLASADRIEEVLQTEDEMKIIPSEPAATDTIIEFDHVSFSYLGVRDNVQDISFRLKEGQTLGIIGATGSGKTTILQLLLRFYDADSGTIRIHGQDIRSLDPKQLRQQTGIVMQNDFIFQDTVRENIAFGRYADEALLQEATQIAQASFIDQLCGRYDYRLNSKGTNLSGGQRQRIFLSRAFLNNPKILLLDDSSSALDYQTDARLRQAIGTHFAHTAKIIVAQRVSSIMHADEILLLDHGRIVARGTHEQLMNTSEVYASISDSQMGGALLE